MLPGILQTWTDENSTTWPEACCEVAWLLGVLVVVLVRHVRDLQLVLHANEDDVVEVSLQRALLTEVVGHRVMLNLFEDF